MSDKYKCPTCGKCPLAYGDLLDYVRTASAPWLPFTRAEMQNEARLILEKHKIDTNHNARGGDTDVDPERRA